MQDGVPTSAADVAESLLSPAFAKVLGSRLISQDSCAVMSEAAAAPRRLGDG